MTKRFPKPHFDHECEIEVRQLYELEDFEQTPAIDKFARWSIIVMSGSKRQTCHQIEGVERRKARRVGILREQKNDQNSDRTMMDRDGRAADPVSSPPTWPFSAGAQGCGHRNGRSRYQQDGDERRT